MIKSCLSFLWGCFVLVVTVIALALGVLLLALQPKTPLTPAEQETAAARQHNQEVQKEWDQHKH